MNILYFVSGVSNRLIVFVAMLAFARILDPENFGRYSLIVGNALFLQVMIGSWISAGARREFAISMREDWPALIQGIIISIIGVSTLLLAAGVALGGAHLVPADMGTIFVVTLLTISLILFETAQAIQNGLGKPLDFAITAIVRAALMLSVGGVVAYYTHSVAAIIVAQILANLVPVVAIAYRKRENFRALHFRGAAQNAARLNNFGVDGTFMFGYYIILMMITKNVVASEYNVALSGTIGLLIDFFFAPLALVSTAISQSYMPRLYKIGIGGEGRIDLKSLPAKFIALLFMWGVLYCIGTLIVIGYVAPPLLPADAGAFGVSYALEFSLFSFGILMTFAVLTVFLTSGMKYSLRSIFMLGILAQISALFWSSSHGYGVADMVWMIAASQLAVSIVSVGYLFALSLRHKVVVDAGDTDRVVANSGDDTGKGGGSRT